MLAAQEPGVVLLVQMFLLGSPETGQELFIVDHSVAIFLHSRGHRAKDNDLRSPTMALPLGKALQKPIKLTSAERIKSSSSRSVHPKSSSRSRPPFARAIRSSSRVTTPFLCGEPQQSGPCVRRGDVMRLQPEMRSSDQ